MQGFISRYYRFLFSFLFAGILILVFLIGREEGRVEAGSAVILSCSDEVLSALSIPTEELVRGDRSIGDITEGEIKGVETAVPQTSVSQGMYVGSKNGTKYYRPTCGTVKRIKPENYVWFDTAEDAQLQGYSEGSC